MSDPEKQCHWRFEDDEFLPYWMTTCDNKFWFGEGGPIENGFLFCPYCGAKLIEEGDHNA